MFRFAFPRGTGKASAMHTRLRLLLHLGLLSLTLANLQAADPMLTLNLRTRSKASGNLSEKPVEWDPAKTPLVICDMWDDHWCKSASRRVAEMAPALNATAKAARAKGVFVVHSPSTCVDFYKGTPQRQRAQRAPYTSTPAPVAQTPRWGTGWCWPDSKHEGGSANR
jgi:hypothetical protein